MKNSYYIFYLFISIMPLMARSELSGNLVILRNLTIAIKDEYVTDNKRLPESWDDIPMIQNMKSDLSSQNPRELKVINMLALVPNSPIVQDIPNSLIKLRNMKLFAISRSEGIDPVFSKKVAATTEGGRYVILVSPDMSDIFVNWISEAEAQVILRQLKEFDPAKQPLAFVDITESERAVETRNDAFRSQITEAYNEKNPQLPENESTNQRVQKNRDFYQIDSGENVNGRVTHSFGWWLIAGFVALASIIAWLKSRMSKS